jgi:hypothetical protein
MVKTLKKRKRIGPPQNRNIGVCPKCNFPMEEGTDFGLCSGLPEEYASEDAILKDGGRYFRCTRGCLPREYLFLKNGSRYSYACRKWTIW